MMEGAWAAKTLVTEYLNQDIPSRLVMFRNHWQKDDEALPDPRMTIQWEPLALDEWPTIITLATGTQDIVREDWDDSGNPKYRVRYAMRTYVWVRDEDPDITTEQRDNMTTVVRDALVDHPALREVPRYEHCEAMVAEESIREEFSELTLVKGDRYLAGAYIAYDLNVTETVTRPPLTETLALMFDLEVFKIPPLPNEPTRLLALPGVTPGTVVLTWKTPTWFGGIAPIDYYQIEVSTNAGVDWTMAVANTGNTHPFRTFAGLDSNTTYLYRVSAVNRIGTGAVSDPSNPVSPV